MNTLYVYLFSVGVALEACAIVYVWRSLRGKSVADSDLHCASYNIGVRSCFEVLRDIRVECGIGVAENAMLEEAFARMGALYK